MKIYNGKLKWGSLVRPLSNDWRDLKDQLLRLNDLIYIEADNEPPSLISVWVKRGRDLLVKGYHQVFSKNKGESELPKSQKASGSEGDLAGVDAVLELSVMTPAK